MCTQSDAADCDKTRYSSAIVSCHQKKTYEKLRVSVRIPYGVNSRLSLPLSPDECLSRILTRFWAEYVWPLYGTLLSRSFPSDQRGSKRANKLRFASGVVLLLYVLPLYNRLVYTKHPLIRITLYNTVYFLYFSGSYCSRLIKTWILHSFFLQLSFANSNASINMIECVQISRQSQHS